ncbi:Stp1/IreP family PP2C-type Ser/Thr phosphatase, partial [candidate division KSB1 bacterium]|nr:Stp1/IreP family PP2C-type Ser/Thr phosphatase [candidate division KSB1 bacterium]
MKLEMVGQTDIGVKRKKNEDFLGIYPELNLGLICDGMGGHNAGALASKITGEIIHSIYESPDKELVKRLSEDISSAYQSQAAQAVSGIRLANRKIFDHASRHASCKGMGTTIVLISFTPGLAILAHVGDSRIYRVRDREISRLTEDHSWINELLEDREIEKEDVRFFEKKNVITRALGIAQNVKIDLQIEPIKAGDLFILCSDGLTNSINEDLIQAIVVNYQNDLQQAVNNLINMALKIDGSDNITVALVKVIDADSENISVKPLKTTIKEENKKIIAYENRYLKQMELNGKMP